MRPVNCGCDMPYGVYCDWLEDMGWDASELREQDEFVGDSTVTLIMFDYGDSHDLLGDGTAYTSWALVGYGEGDSAFIGYRLWYEQGRW